jgi:PAS domain S-box-containing protein
MTHPSSGELHATVRQMADGGSAKAGFLPGPQPRANLCRCAWMLFSCWIAQAGAGPTDPSVTPQLDKLFWALFLMVACVPIGIIWAGLIRRNVRKQTETIRVREEALAEHYRELFENAHDIIFTHDQDGKLTSLNKAGEEILGYTREEASKISFDNLIAPGQQASFRALLQQLKDGLPGAHCEVEMRAKDGRRVVLRVNLRMQQGSGRPRVQGIAWDITERKRAEEALQESEQRLRRSLEERVQLGRDLHDGIIQSIYAIGLGLQECRNLLKKDPALAEARLTRAIADSNAVIRDVRNFIVGLEPEALKGPGFRSALQSLVSTLNVGESAQFLFDIDPDAADLLNARQAAHLLQIAREAMSNSLRHARAKTTSVSLKKQNDCVQLEVSDNGIGFEKQAGAGKGHGLRNIVARAAELLARNEIISTPGQGTRIWVEIPLSQFNEAT